MTDTYTQLLGWHDFLHVRQDKVRGDVEYFCMRAGELAELVKGMLSAGYSASAEQVLGDLSEGDMVDFAILVDLADGVDIPDVEPLPASVRDLLQRFLHNDPWRALVVDTNIIVCLAMLRSYGHTDEDSIWYHSEPHLVRSLSKAFEGVDREQFNRLVAEINALSEDPNTSFDAELIGMATVSAELAAERLGLKPPVLFN
ncbi:MAG: hypothetical protein RIC89_19670 [Pseudomonadales bacterium]